MMLVGKGLTGGKVVKYRMGKISDDSNTYLINRISEWFTWKDFIKL
jgi:hypothetical protein